MFELHPRLAADCHIVGDLPLSRLLLSNDRRWPWLILVPRRADIRDLDELTSEDRGRLMNEAMAATAAIRALHDPHKMNVAALGNMVPQLHLHVIGRFREDPAWPGPVWGVGTAEPYPPAEAEAAVAAFRERLLG